MVPGLSWPDSVAELEELQQRLAELAQAAPLWSPPAGRSLRVAAVFAAAHRGLVGRGAAGDPAWVAAVLWEESRLTARAVLADSFRAPYQPGLLALREGELLERAVRALGTDPDLVLVDATGRDHPRRAGLALHLGAALDLPSIGVTDRPLLAAPIEGRPAEQLWLEGELVAFRLAARPGVRPVVVHAGWRVDVDTATEVVRRLLRGARTPEPLRQARRLARTLRAGRLR